MADLKLVTPPASLSDREILERAADYLDALLWVKTALPGLIEYAGTRLIPLREGDRWFLDHLRRCVERLEIAQEHDE